MPGRGRGARCEGQLGQAPGASPPAQLGSEGPGLALAVLHAGRVEPNAFLNRESTAFPEYLRLAR
jgi:hypothetical protein